MYRLLLCLAYVFLSQCAFGTLGQRSASEPEFVILITSYNNERWASDNLKSACCQKSSRPYHVLCVNDCSSDKTGEVMDNYIAEHNLSSLVTVIHNKERVGALCNIYNAIHSLISDNKIVVSLDGDDTLAHDGVLLQLERTYKESDIWITYGSYLKVPEGKRGGAAAIPAHILEQNRIRHYKWLASHLRTFKAGLFKKIKKEDLMYRGKFFPTTFDLAMMFPMLEMASTSHSRFIYEILYHYRVNNPISVFKTKKPQQKFFAKYIRKKTPYEPIKSL